MEIKARVFCLLLNFIVVSQHRVQVSCTSSYTPKNLIHAAYAAQYTLLSSFTNSFTAKAVPHMLSSVLTDVMQMLPSAVNTHTESNKYQYMFVEKPLYNNVAQQFSHELCNILCNRLWCTNIKVEINP